MTTGPGQYAGPLSHEPFRHFLCSSVSVIIYTENYTVFQSFAIIYIFSLGFCHLQAPSVCVHGRFWESALIELDKIYPVESGTGVPFLYLSSAKTLQFIHALFAFKVTVAEVVISGEGDHCHTVDSPKVQSSCSRHLYL